VDLAGVSTHSPVTGRSARTLTFLKVPLSSQTQVGRLTVDFVWGFSSTLVLGTSIWSYA
jgi:hypothetical protein